MIQQKLDTLLASHTAPTLMGVKPANLVSLPRFETFEQMVQNYNAHLNQQDIYFHPVCQCNCKQLLLVYRKSELVKTLCEPQKRAFLLSYGYPVYHKNNVEPYFDEILTYLAPVSYTHLDVYKRQQSFSARNCTAISFML